MENDSREFGKLKNRVAIEVIQFENQRNLTLLEKLNRTNGFFIGSWGDNDISNSYNCTNKSAFNFYLLRLTPEKVTEKRQRQREECYKAQFWDLLIFIYFSVTLTNLALFQIKWSFVQNTQFLLFLK